MCGGNTHKLVDQLLAHGLSPRVRGKLCYGYRQATPKGSIPACAGETRIQTRQGAAPEVYPRVCGGNRNP